MSHIKICNFFTKKCLFNNLRNFFMSQIPLESTVNPKYIPTHEFRRSFFALLEIQVFLTIPYSRSTSIKTFFWDWNKRKARYQRERCLRVQQVACTLEPTGEKTINWYLSFILQLGSKFFLFKGPISWIQLYSSKISSHLINEATFQLCFSILAQLLCLAPSRIVKPPSLNYPI